MILIHAVDIEIQRVKPSTEMHPIGFYDEMRRKEIEVITISAQIKVTQSGIRDKFGEYDNVKRWEFTVFYRDIELLGVTEGWHIRRILYEGMPKDVSLYITDINPFGHIGAAPQFARIRAEKKLFE